MTRAARFLVALATIAALVAGLLVARQVVVASSQRLQQDLIEDRLGGAIVDHVVRVRQGLPIYAEPDDHFVPVVYTPLYYHGAAALMALVPDALKACRITSLGCIAAATLALALLVFWTTRSAWATALVPLVAAAGYRACEYFYDAPRTDPAAALFGVAGVVVAARWRGAWSGLALAALFTLAFWSKQSSGLFAAAFLLLLLIDGRDGWRRALVGGVTCVVLILGSLFLVNRATDGWFWRIAIALSGEHEFPFERLVATLRQDWLGPLLPSLVAVVVFVITIALAAIRRRPELDHDPRSLRVLRVLFLALLAMALFTSVSRARTGGTQKVLIPLVLLLSAALPLGAWWLGERLGSCGRFLPRAGLAALLAFAWFPVADALPSAAAVKRWDELLATVRTHAKQGQVWLAPWGYVTTRMNGQSMRPTLLALDDWLGVRGHATGNPIPPRLADALARQEFAAILFPSTGRQRNLRPELDQSYRLLAELDPISFGVEERAMVLGVFVPRRRQN